MPGAKLQDHGLSIKALGVIATDKMWKGKAGGRHWRLFRTLYLRSLKSAKPEMTMSLADMALATNISSHRGLRLSIDFLVENGLLEVLDRGEPDQHGDQRKKGRPGTYKIRYRGATDTPTCSPTSIMSNSCSPLPSQVMVGRGVGGSPLPNERFLAEYDMSLDLWVKEPHLLRLLDLMAIDGINYLSDVTPTKLADVLGLSVSGAWEMLQRWEKKLIVHNGTLDARRIDTHETRTSHSKLTTKIRKAVAIRAEALAGRYMATRWRAQQRVRLVKAKCGFQVVDGEWASTIWKMQQDKGERGLVPWLDAYEFASVA